MTNNLSLGLVTASNQTVAKKAIKMNGISNSSNNNNNNRKTYNSVKRVGNDKQNTGQDVIGDMKKNKASGNKANNNINAGKQ